MYLFVYTMSRVEMFLLVKHVHCQIQIASKRNSSIQIKSTHTRTHAHTHTVKLTSYLKTPEIYQLKRS